MTETSAAPSRVARFLAGIPWWVRLVLGAAATVLGLILVTRPSASIELFVVLAGSAFIVVGVTSIVGALEVRRPWGDLVLGAVLTVLGVFTLLWLGATVELLSFFVAAALILSGAGGILSALYGTSDERIASAIFGLAGIAFGVFILSWPRLSLSLLGIVFSGWLVFFGLSHIVGVLISRFRKPREASEIKPRRRGSWLRVIAAALSLIVAVALLVATSALRAGDPRIVPDAFYTPPITVPSEPGQLIRYEPMSEGVPGGTQAWRILYTTTQPDGSPAVSSGTVIAPAELPAEPLPLVAVAHGTSGIVPGCAPSVSAAPFADGAGTALERIVATGWAGVISDYVGLGTAGPHQYLVGEAEARNVLDSVRAAHQLSTLTLDDRTVVWGHSQGGHAAVWTGIIAPEYAPEIELIGVAAFAPATDLYSLAEGIKDSPAGKIVSAYIAASWAATFPDLDVDDLVTPRYRGLIPEIGELCFSGKGALAAATITTQMFDAIFLDTALDGRLGDLLRENTPTGPVDVPLLIAQGGADQLVLPTMQEKWVADRCAAGQKLDFRIYPGLDHLPLVAADSPLTDELVQWTSDRLAGKEALSTC